MQLPHAFQDHAPLRNLYHGVKAALEPTFLGPHAEQLAFRAVLHATAWLSENAELHAPYYASETPDQILYHHNDRKALATDVYLSALFTGPALNRTGLAVWANLNGPDTDQAILHATRLIRECATSFWRNHLQLLTRYGLDFDAHLRSDDHAA